MRARIGREIRRPALTTQIDEAIVTAIGAYAGTRWAFNERRDVTFATIASQEFYGTAAHASIPLLRKLDYAKVYVGGTAYDLKPSDPSTMEDLSDSATNTGQPSEYVYYAKQLRLYPVPDAVYTVRLAGQFVVAAPASDSEADNPWMIDAERLIRSRAKLELCVHVTFDQIMAQAMGEAVRDAESDLKGTANMMTGTSRVKAFSL